MKRRGFFKGLLAGGVAGGTTLAARAVAQAAPVVVEKPVEVIKEVLVPAPPRRLSRSEIKGFIAGPCSIKQLDILAADEPRIVHCEHDEYVTWNGIGFIIPAGDPLLPGPIAYVLSQSRQEDLRAEVDDLYEALNAGEGRG